MVQLMAVIDKANCFYAFIAPRHNLDIFKHINRRFVLKDNKEPDVALSAAQREFVEKLIIENKASVYAIVRNVLGAVNGYLFEDCISEVYLLLCKKVSDLENHPSPKAWLYIAAKMTARGVISKHKNDQSNVSLEFSQSDAPLEDFLSTSHDPTYEEAMYHIYLESDIDQKILEILTQKEVQVYQKLFLQKKSIKEAASELCMSESTIRTHKMAVKDKIAKLIDKGV